MVDDKSEIVQYDIVNSDILQLRAKLRIVYLAATIVWHLSSVHYVSVYPQVWLQTDKTWKLVIST